jgi:predicted glycoside hydrolase/deacetylase ChbG (UPF0249 family)
VRARADIGLHLDLTEFARPAGGHLRLALAAYAGMLAPDRLRALIDEQLQRFEDAAGTPPDYVDGHRHIHQLPRVRDALLSALLERYGTARPWLRVSRVQGFAAGGKALLVSVLGGDAMAQRCRALGFACNERLLGFYNFAGSQDDQRARLQGWLAQARSGDALMCHPAARAEDGDPIGAARCTEFAVLASDWWPAALAAADVVLGRGAALATRLEGGARHAA